MLVTHDDSLSGDEAMYRLLKAHLEKLSFAHRATFSLKEQEFGLDSARFWASPTAVFDVLFFSSMVRLTEVCSVCQQGYLFQLDPSGVARLGLCGCGAWKEIGFASLFLGLATSEKSQIKLEKELSKSKEPLLAALDTVEFLDFLRFWQESYWQETNLSSTDG